MPQARVYYRPNDHSALSAGTAVPRERRRKFGHRGDIIEVLPGDQNLGKVGEAKFPCIVVEGAEAEQLRHLCEPELDEDPGFRDEHGRKRMRMRSQRKVKLNLGILRGLLAPEEQARFDRNGRATLVGGADEFLKAIRDRGNG